MAARKLKPGERWVERGGRKVIERELTFAGYIFKASPVGTEIQRERIDVTASGDYGADPLGDGTFRMVPSGDIVDSEERNRRLKRYS